MPSNNKTMVSVVGGVLVLLALALGVFFGHGSATPADQTGGASAMNEVKEYFVNGLQLGGENENWIPTHSIGAGDNNDCWQNTTGRTVYADLATFTTDGTASTTFTIDIATSTTCAISDYTSPFSELIDSYQLSTSTVAKTINSIKNGGTNGTNVVAVPDDTYVSVLISAGEPAQVGAPTCDGSVCETATSTNRGFNAKWRLHYFYEGEQ